MDKEAIMAHAKRYSEALRQGRQTPWNDPEAVAEMGNKTVLRRLLKYVPESPQVAAVLAHENDLDRAAMRVVNAGAIDAVRRPALGRSRSRGRAAGAASMPTAATATAQRRRTNSRGSRSRPSASNPAAAARHGSTQPEPEPEQTQQVADDDGGEPQQQRRGRRTDEQIANDLVADIERAPSAKELDEVMRGLKGRVATNPTYRKRIEDAEKARRAQGFGNPEAEPVITAFGAPMQSWQAVAALVDAKLKESEATGIYGAEGMDDETYTRVPAPAR